MTLGTRHETCAADAPERLAPLPKQSPPVLVVQIHDDV
jgi:hypothetical protein